MKQKFKKNIVRVGVEPQTSRLVVCLLPRYATEAAGMTVEFYLYPTVSTALVHSVKPKLTE